MFETSAINVPPTPEPRSRWKHGPIPVVGLIGGVGGGKTPRPPCWRLAGRW